MGQAKQRGTYKQRKNAAMDKEFNSRLFRAERGTHRFPKNTSGSSINPFLNLTILMDNLEKKSVT